jgi:hypothetical protein
MPMAIGSFYRMRRGNPEGYSNLSNSVGMTFRLQRYTQFDLYLDELRQRIEETGARKIAAARFDAKDFDTLDSIPWANR